MNINFVKHFRTNKTFRISIIIFAVGMMIALVPTIIGMEKSMAKTIITAIGVMLSFSATEQLSKIITVIGAQDAKDREVRRKSK